MAYLIKRGDGSSHFYHKDGKPQHDATLREARKLLLYPSVTTLDKQIWVNEFLDSWKQEQIVIACLENPRQPHESPEDYANRVYDLSLTKSRVAAEFGQKIHDAIDVYPAQPSDNNLVPWIDKFDAWYRDNIAEKIGSEVTLLDHDIGVAGRTDLRAIHKVHGRCIVDYKSQGIKPDDKGRKAANYYPSWIRQLAFYAVADAKESGMFPQIPTCISLVIDSTEATAPYMRVWEPETIRAAYKTFVVGVWMWCNGNQKRKPYWPTGKEWDLVPSVQLP